MTNETNQPVDSTAPYLPDPAVDQPATDTGPSLADEIARNEPEPEPEPEAEAEAERKEKPAKLKVKAKARGIYPNGVQREKGDRFTIEKEEDFSDRWMRLDNEAVDE